MILALLFVATAAPANTPTVPNKPSAPVTPLSVWRTDEAGAMEHLQSGLVCPEKLGAFRRTDTTVFDKFGLDVDCNYSAGAATVTVYLTRREGADIDAAMAEAKRQLIQYGAAKNPRPLSETRSDEAGLGWRTALYVEDGGVHTGIWIADLSGWTLEYRATYPAADEAELIADLRPVTANVTETAGRRLALCARSQPPQRTGRAVTDKKQLEQAAIMTSLIGGASQAATAQGKAATPAPPPTWCVERTVTRGDLNLLYWRAVNDSGSDASSDRISLPTTGLPPVLTVAPDSLANLVDALSKRGPKQALWVATLQDGERTLIFGYFDDRPSAEALGDLMSEILVHKAKAIGGYSAKGKDISIIMPPK